MRPVFNELVCVHGRGLHLLMFYVGPKESFTVSCRAVAGIPCQRLVADALVHLSVGLWELLFEPNIFHYVLDMWVYFFNYI